MHNRKYFYSNAAVVLLFSVIFLFLSMKQDALFISGSTIFNGFFEEKLGLYSLIFSAIVITSLFLAGAFLFRSQIVCSEKNEKIHATTSARAMFTALAVSAGILGFSILLSPNRWNFRGAGPEQLYYLALMAFTIHKTRKVTNSLLKSVALPLVAFFMIAHQPNTAGIPVTFFGISADTYHSGEYYIPAKLLADGIFGFFSEYNPSRGLTNYYPAMFAYVFGTLPDFEKLFYYEISTIAFTLTMISFLLIINVPFVLRICVSLFLGTSALGGIHSAVSLMIPITWYVTNRLNPIRPYQFFLVGIIASFILVLNSTGEGVVWTAVFFSVYSLEWMKTIYSLKEGRFRYLLFVFLLLTAYVCVVLFLAPNLIEYVLGNGSLNTAAHSIFQISDFKSDIRFLKYGFVLFAPLLFLCSVIYDSKEQSGVAKFSLICFGVIVVGLVRFMGRDDQGTLSRPFAATLLASISFLLVSLHTFDRLETRARILLFLMATFIIGKFAWFGEFANRFLFFPYFSASRVEFDKKFPENVKSSVQSIYQFEKEFSQSVNCQNLVDISGNNSVFALSSSLKIIPTTSSYNSVSRAEQDRIIGVLRDYAKNGGVCVRVMHQNIDHDGGAILLRAPELGQYLFSEMTLVDLRGKESLVGIWLSSSSSKEQGKSKDADLTDEVGDLRFYFDGFTNLSLLPRTWGKSYNRTAALIGYGDAIGALIPPEVRRSLIVAVFSGGREYSPTRNCKVFLEGSAGKLASFQFEASHEGAYLVPLYGHSSWYLDEVVRIRWDCPNLLFNGFDRIY